MKSLLGYEEGMDPELFQKAIAAFDETNAQDPKKEIWEGKEVPYELLYSRWMSKWVEKLDPNASESAKLAARSQHLCRWMIPRTDFEPGRIGYLKWRKRLYQFHAEKAGEILGRLGLPAEIIRAVQEINLKKNMKDPKTQLIEDALCLVFLEHQFHDFVKKTAPEKMPDIIKKTWAKMSTRAQEAALQIPFSPEDFALIKSAMAG